MCNSLGLYDSWLVDLGMSMRRNLLIILMPLMCCLPLNVQGQAQGLPPGEGITTARKLKAFLSFMPPIDLKSTAQDYLQIIKPDLYESDLVIRGANYGIQDFLIKKFNADQRFQQQAISFYQAVADHMALRLRGPKEDSRNDLENDECRDDGQGSGPFLIHYTCEKKQGRTQLSESAGIGKNGAYQPGWLWNLAIKSTNGDANEAMDLIALCGHDNRFQGEKKIRDNSSSAQPVIQKKLAALYEYLESARKVRGGAESIKELQDQIVEIRKTGIDRYLNCPTGGSPFYVPGSLAAEADISPSLKQKIQSIQDPKGTKNLPAKYYHVFGEAFIACKLVQKGHSREAIVAVAKLASHFYRGVALCNDVNSDARVQEILQNEYLKERSAKPLEDFILDKMNEVKMPLPGNERKNFQDVISDLNEKIEENQHTREKYSDAQRRALVIAFLAQYDAAFLYREWFKGSTKIAGLIDWPCTSKQIFGPKNLWNPLENGESYKPPGWDLERFVRASRKLATYIVDFEWTMAQHAAGATFATNVCRSTGY